MKLAPLQVYHEPDYPTQEAVRHHPELLRLLPRRWHHNPLVLGAMAGLISLMEQSMAGADDQPKLRVAPIFEHGKGQGAYGCMVINPPVFLTEAEAREIIEAEAKNAGLEFTERDHQIIKVPVPYVEKFVVWEDPKPDAPPTSGTSSDGKKWLRGGGNPAERFQKKSPEQTHEVTRGEDVKLAGWNPRKQVGYRFVSREDFEARHNSTVVPYEKLPDGHIQPIRGSSVHTFSTVSNYDVLGAAQRVRRGLDQINAPGTVAVFYDPLCSPVRPPARPNWKLWNDKEPSAEKLKTRDKAFQEYKDAYHASGKVVSAEELRQQVRDYLAWLKAQGVI